MSNRDEISGKVFSGQVFRRIFPYLKPVRLRFSLSLVMVFVATLAAIYSPRLLGRLVDEALVKQDRNVLINLSLLYLGLELLRAAFTFAQSIILQGLGQIVMHKIRGDLFEHLVRMPVPFFDQNPVGRLVTRVTNDTTNLSELFSAGFISFLADIALIVGIIIAMIGLEWKLALAGIAAFPFMVLCMRFFSGRLQVAFRNSRQSLAMVNGYFAERVAAMAIVQMMGRENHENQEYQKVSRDYRDRQFDTVFLYSLFHPAITLLSALSVIGVLFYGAALVQSGALALGTLVAFLAYVQNLYQPVRSVTDKYNTYLAAMASAERIFSLLDLEEESGLRLDHTQTKKEKFLGRLEFNNVSFRYPKTRADINAENSPEQDVQTKQRPLALDKVSLTIEPGQKMAVIGATGAGKSTLVALLFRFYEPSEGSIFLDGRSLSQIPKKELRSRIGYVQQEVFVFAETLRENLRLLAPNASDAKILEMCKLTGFLEVIERLPEGLDTKLDERGSNLSLGERQILAVTRTLLQDPEILVLDEATASVDHLAERKIQSAINVLMKNRSALVIAHRLATIRSADQIFVFSDGKIAESGSHDSLISQNSIYRSMLAQQSLL